MSVQIRLAREATDIDALFRLRHQVYVEEEGRFSSAAFPEERIMDRFDTFDSSVNLIAFCRGEAAGFIRVTGDGPLGLPVDEHYDLAAARALCRERTAGISMFGVRRPFRRELAVSIGLLRATLQYIRSQSYEDAVAVVNGEIEPLLFRFGMRRVGEPFFCTRVGQVLVCMHGRLEEAPVSQSTLAGEDSNRGRVLLADGERLYERGAPGGLAYLVLSGEVELSLETPGGQQRSIGRSGAGELVGELELFPTQRRSYTATARGFSELLEIPSEDLLSQLNQGGSRLQQILSVLNRRMDDAARAGSMGEQERLSGLRLFNDYLTCRVVHTLGGLRFFEALGPRPRFDPGALARDMGIPVDHLLALLDFLRQGGVLRREGAELVFEPEVLERLNQEYGFIEWLLGAYDPLLDGLERLIRGEARYGRDVRRDDFAVARSSASISRVYTDPHMYAILEMEGVETIADIGTGSGLRLIEICTRFPKLKAIGIDISPDCCEVARQNVRRAGMQDRITIVEGRAEQWLSRAKEEGFARVDMVMCFAMFHDLLNREGLAEEFLSGILGGLRPGAFVMIQDQLRLPEDGASARDSWVSGFELIHHFMGQRLFTRERYEEVFAGAGLSVVQRVATPIPENWIYLLRVGEEAYLLPPPAGGGR